MNPIILKPFQNIKIISESNVDFILKATTGPSKLVKIPKLWTKSLAFLLGIFLGDGHLMNNRKRISLELTNRELLNSVRLMLKEVFNFDVIIRARNPRQANWKKLYYIYVDSSAIFQFFEQLGIPKGNKSRTVKVPNVILKTRSKFLKEYFVKGVFSAEGGNRKKKGYYGMSSASEQFIKDMIVLLCALGITANYEKWLNKRYKREYFGLYFKKSNQGDLYAGVPEWSNGLIHASET